MADPAGYRTSVPDPARKWVRRSAAAGKPPRANPAAIRAPSALSAVSVAGLQWAVGVCSCVSWLPLARTGRSPRIVKDTEAAGERVAAAEETGSAADPEDAVAAGPDL